MKGSSSENDMNSHYYVLDRSPSGSHLPVHTPSPSHLFTAFGLIVIWVGEVVFVMVAVPTNDVGLSLARKIHSIPTTNTITPAIRKLDDLFACIPPGFFSNKSRGSNSSFVSGPVFPVLEILAGSVLVASVGGFVCVIISFCAGRCSSSCSFCTVCLRCFSSHCCTAHLWFSCFCACSNCCNLVSNSPPSQGRHMWCQPEACLPINGPIQGKHPPSKSNSRDPAAAFYRSGRLTFQTGSNPGCRCPKPWLTNPGC